MTRLLLSLLRLVAANRSAALGAARGRGAGQYRRLVPAAAEAGYGLVGGYRRPSPGPHAYAAGTAGSDASWVEQDRRHDDGYGDADDYGDPDGHADVDRYGPWVSARLWPRGWPW